MKEPSDPAGSKNSITWALGNIGASVVGIGFWCILYYSTVTKRNHRNKSGAQTLLTVDPTKLGF